MLFPIFNVGPGRMNRVSYRQLLVFPNAPVEYDVGAAATTKKKIPAKMRLAPSLSSSPSSSWVELL